MSIQALSCAMALRGVTASEKLLLLALANYADEQMRCYPSQNRLADDTSLSARSIRSMLVALEERKIISRLERWRQDGSRATDLITLHFSGIIVSGGVAEAASGGAETVSGGVRKPFPGGAETVSALTTFEPSSEPSEKSILAARDGRKRASRTCPSDWKPTDADVVMGVAEGFTAGEIERELAKFRDYEFRTPHSDWSKTFRNWLRNAAERRPRQAHERHHPDRSPTAREDRLGRMLAGAVAAVNERKSGVG